MTEDFKAQDDALESALQKAAKDIARERVRALISQKVYLGDAVYARFECDTEQIVLTAEDGYRALNTIYLEPEVLRMFESYIRDLRSRIEHAGGRL